MTRLLPSTIWIWKKNFTFCNFHRVQMLLPSSLQKWTVFLSLLLLRIFVVNIKYQSYKLPSFFCYFFSFSFSLFFSLFYSNNNVCIIFVYSIHNVYNTICVLCCVFCVWILTLSVQRVFSRLHTECDCVSVYKQFRYILIWNWKYRNRTKHECQIFPCRRLSRKIKRYKQKTAVRTQPKEREKERERERNTQKIILYIETPMKEARKKTHSNTPISKWIIYSNQENWCQIN